MTRLILLFYLKLTTPSKRKRRRTPLSLKTKRTPDVSWRSSLLMAMLVKASMPDALSIKNQLKRWKNQSTTKIISLMIFQTRLWRPNLKGAEVVETEGTIVVAGAITLLSTVAEEKEVITGAEVAETGTTTEAVVGTTTRGVTIGTKTGGRTKALAKSIPII